MHAHDRTRMGTHRHTWTCMTMHRDDGDDGSHTPAPSASPGTPHTDPRPVGADGGFATPKRRYGTGVLARSPPHMDMGAESTAEAKPARGETGSTLRPVIPCRVPMLIPALLTLNPIPARPSRASENALNLLQRIRCLLTVPCRERAQAKTRARARLRPPDAARMVMAKMAFPRHQLANRHSIRGCDLRRHNRSSRDRTVAIAIRNASSHPGGTKCEAMQRPTWKSCILVLLEPIRNPRWPSCDDEACHPGGAPPRHPSLPGPGASASPSAGSRTR